MKFKLACLFFLLSWSVISQKKVALTFNNIPLSEVIVTLEKTFNIKLSFSSELLNNQTLTFNKDQATLEQVLNSIERQTSIEFEKVTDRYYIIKQQNVLDLSQVQNLDEVLISEYLTSGIAKNRDGSIKLLPGSLGILPGLTEPDVLQSLQLLPGIQSPNETASGLYIRGGTPDQNLILWDGIKMYHSGHFFGMISSFNPYIINDVKLYTSGTRAKYGSRISSVIDITSSNTIPENIEGGFGFNMTHTDAHIKTPIGKKVAVIVSARRSFNDILESFTFKNLSERVFQNTKISNGGNVLGDNFSSTTDNLFYFSDVTLKAIAKPSPKDEIIFSNLITKNKLDYGFEFQEINDSTRDQLNIENKGSSILWNHDSSNTFSYSIQAYLSNFDLDYSGNDTYGDSYVSDVTRQNGVDDIGFLFNTNWNLNETHSLGFGYQLSSQEIQYKLGFVDQFGEEEPQTFVFEDRSGSNTHALYADYQYNKVKKLIFNAGLRANYISAFDKVFMEPRLSLQVWLSGKLKGKFSVEQLHQPVSQIVEFVDDDFGLENQTWVLADGQAVPVLESFQTTTGLNFNASGWTLDIDMYLKNIVGLSSLTRGFDNPNNFSFFAGKSKVLGLDVLIKKKIDNYRTWLSYSYIKNRFTFSDVNDGNPFPGNFDITNHLTWSHSYLWKNFNFSLGWNIRTGTPYTEATGIDIDDDGFLTINYSKTNGERLSDYHRLDFSSTYTFNLSKDQKWKGKLGLSLLNIYNNKSVLNRTYRAVPVFNNDEVTYELRTIDKVSLGMTPNVVFRVEF